MRQALLKCLDPLSRVSGFPAVSEQSRAPTGLNGCRRALHRRRMQVWCGSGELSQPVDVFQIFTTPHITWLETCIRSRPTTGAAHLGTGAPAPVVNCQLVFTTHPARKTHEPSLQSLSVTCLLARCFGGHGAARCATSRAGHPQGPGSDRTADQQQADPALSLQLPSACKPGRFVSRSAGRPGAAADCRGNGGGNTVPLRAEFALDADRAAAHHWRADRQCADHPAHERPGLGTGRAPDQQQPVAGSARPAAAYGKPRMVASTSSP